MCYEGTGYYDVSLTKKQHTTFNKPMACFLQDFLWVLPQESLVRTLGPSTSLCPPFYEKSVEDNEEECRNAGKIKLVDVMDMSYHEVGENLGRPGDRVSLPEGIGNVIARFCMGKMIFIFFFVSCVDMNLVPCPSAACRARRRMFDETAPQCSWKSFRDFIVTALGCLGQEFMCVFSESESLTRILRSHTQVSGVSHDKDKKAIALQRSYCMDIRGIVDLYSWMHRLSYGNWNYTDNLSRLWNPGHVELASRALQASFADQLLCPNRIWNLSFQSPRGLADVPHLVEQGMLQFVSIDQSEPSSNHESCTDQNCLLSRLNTTVVPQTHRCRTGDCRAQTKFSIDLLNHVYRPNYYQKWRNTSWSLPKSNNELQTTYEPRLYDVDDEHTEGYMALSHVWSDGTGGGNKDPGLVNQCLFNYFANIAMRLDCSRLWWDTVCIPTEREARNIAINNIIETFRRANVTVVHDLALTKVPWTENGTPAVALVLSSWFTRGWTAAELWASRKHPVKVLFGDPNNMTGPPLIKDLDDDILARDVSVYPSLDGDAYKMISDPRKHAPSMAHLLATDIIRLLRPQDDEFFVMSFSRLTRMLRTRSTAWPRDQLVIAGLMCDKALAQKTDREITIAILAHCAEIDFLDVLHGQVTRFDFCAPWEWCPPSLFDLGQTTGLPAPIGRIGSNRPVSISANGVLKFDSLTAYELLPEDILIPYDGHPALQARISAITMQIGRNSCLLLTDYDLEEEYGIYILAQPTRVSYRYSGQIRMGRRLICDLECHWLGCVSLSKSAHDNSDERWCTEDIDTVSFGCRSDGSDIALPMTTLSLGISMRSYIKARDFGTHLRWYLTDIFPDRDSPTYLDQPVQMYGLEELGSLDEQFTCLRSLCRDMGEALPPRISRRGLHTLEPIVVFDPSASENLIWIRYLDQLVRVWERFRHSKDIDGTSISSKIEYKPGDQIELIWGFPHRLDNPRSEIAGEDRCFQPAVYKSTFRAVHNPIEPEYQAYMISIGRHTVASQIKPIIDFADFDDAVFVISGWRCSREQSALERGRIPAAIVSRYRDVVEDIDTLDLSME
ncbi:hypothetical protein AA0119_g11789 [Alternaria tenuissima]|uniref:Heterokaryon incompatibility domain-containing protein n=1 Tax=Alternaria tenuissima TaxID=119927 RepID=A0A4Q4QSB3_9PLEO|nr:hypothetical protein AA0115_g8962 [Alternaria tenuissima]RYN88487.1 hypothetical protein AA0119_g11789 [Alternaria tenuissima]RYO07764.1 hypothetical protein AA0121_g11541 [Alternaria tenuissima]RYO45896.1 hypothetical protein AA0116_g12949 [Alternaria tenuissima]